MIFFTLLIRFCLLFPMFVCAMPENKPPEALMYLGKPIDPLCLFDIVHTKAVVDLSECGIDLTKKYAILGKNQQLIAQGFIGYDYSIKADNTNNLQGYSYYKPLGAVQNAVIVQTINNSGGTGSFSFLNLIQRKGNRIKISVLHGGDRCNGAMVDVKRISEGDRERLVYSVYVTAYDFFALAKDNPHNLKAYDDLSACAVCCVATAVYERNIDTDFAASTAVPTTTIEFPAKAGIHGHQSLRRGDSLVGSAVKADFAKEKLLYVNVKPQTVAFSPSSPPYQACFNKLLEHFSKKNGGKLDVAQLSQFVHEFNTRCLIE